MMEFLKQNGAKRYCELGFNFSLTSSKQAIQSEIRPTVSISSVKNETNKTTKAKSNTSCRPSAYYLPIDYYSTNGKDRKHQLGPIRSDRVEKKSRRRARPKARPF